MQMKDFIDPCFDPMTCRQQLDEFRVLLDDSEELQEQTDLLPFFRERTHLSAFMASYHPDVCRYDRFASEYPLFGDFVCDFVIGDSERAAYCFVEFEDATPTSVFRPRSSRAVPEWSPRFEHGFSQILDWFWKLDDMKATTDFEGRFASRIADYMGILIIGRDKGLDDINLQRRLQWRRDRVTIDSRKVHCRTFDQLYSDLDDRLTTWGFHSDVSAKSSAVTVSPMVAPDRCEM